VYGDNIIFLEFRTLILSDNNLMGKKSRWILGILAFLLLVFGLGCLNYTKASGLEHHQEVARRHNLPEPGPGILYGGVGAIIVGSGMIGYVIGRRG